MDERIARLRAHQKNIERYQSLLKTELTEVEVHYLEKLLSEERVSRALTYHSALTTQPLVAEIIAVANPEWTGGTDAQGA